MNHRLLGSLYIASGLVLGIVAYFLSIIMRIELMRPAESLISKQTPEIYNSSITLHGIGMIFLFAMPSLYGGWGNIKLPLVCLTPEVPFPRINNLSYLILVFSISLIATYMVGQTNNGLGWVLYPPLSTSAMSLSSLSLIGLCLGLVLNGLSLSLIHI